MFLPLLLLSCFCLFGAYIWILPPHVRRYYPFGRRYVVPPGPRGRPLLGNLPEWLRARNGGKMMPWLLEQARYGEMTTLSMGTKTWVLLNSSRVHNEIIAKRSNITHERPYFPIASGLVSRDKRVFLHKTKDWREPRRLLHHAMMGASRAEQHGQLAEAASLGLLQAYLDHPRSWYAHHYRYAISTMHRIITDRPLQKSTTDLEDLQNVTSSFLTSINSHFVDFFPQLRFVPKPLQFWRHHWERMGQSHFDVFKRWWDGMRPMFDPAVGPSFVRDSVVQTYADRDEQAMYLTMFILSAGSDNPRMTMNAWAMSCLAYPDAMQRAREEIDSVCGGRADRLPSLSDLPDCPYTCAVVKEVLRWRPTVPLIPQRVLIEDLDFEGYRFPAGTEFLVNTIAVCQNGYDRPDEFRPGRWLEGKEPGSGVEQDLWQFAFNGGRRMCVGYKLAQKELFIAFARLLYCFNFSPRGPFDDKELNAFKLGEPFPLKVTARTPSHAKLVREQAAKYGELRREWTSVT